VARAGSKAVMFAMQSDGGAKEEEAPRTFLITSHAAKLEQLYFCVRGYLLLPRIEIADQLY